MDLKLSGKRALITGGSRGIGLAIKKALEKEGVEVISWSRSEGVDLLNTEGIIPNFPRVDILINNVGGGGTWREEDSYKVFGINCIVMQELTRLFLGQAIRGSRVITISSIFGKEKGNNATFTASKAYQIAYMKSLAGKYEGITFNTICPGHIDVGKAFPDNPQIIGKPEDVAGIVTFLCSDYAKHINGACITVDGGESHSF